MTDTSTFRPARLRQGVLLALVGHAAVVIGAFVAGRVVRPTPGDGFEDLKAIVFTLSGGELLLGLVCLVAGALLFRKDERERGIGLIAGWLVGLALVVTVIRTTTR